MPPHHVNKARRREQILRAARALMTENEDADFSMELLAQRAGVSIATPYALIGSKNQIIVALHAWETSQFQAMIDRIEERDPILRLLKSVDATVDFHLVDERYFKALSRAAFTALPPVQAYYHAESERWFLDRLRPIVSAGLLDPDCHVTLLARVLAQIYFAGIRDWVNDITPADDLKVRFGYAISVFLLGVVIPSRRDQVRDIMLDRQAALAEGMEPPVLRQSALP
jgi:AcrR family transcriptional regulator